MDTGLDLLVHKAENIALVPVGGGAPGEVGMYGLSSWHGTEKK